MSRGLTTLHTRVELIKNATTTKAAFDTYCETLSGFSFPYIFAGRGATKPDEEMTPEHVYFCREVEDFLKHYIEKRYVYVDPVAAHIPRERRSFRWRAAHHDMSPEQAAQVKDAQNFGLKFGLVVPVMMGPGLPAFVSMGRETDFDLSLGDVIEIEVLSQYMFDQIETIVRRETGDGNYRLSKKEHEILDLVANGKTNWEIGQIMSISEYSVRDYLKALSERFETSNRTHTVVRAIQLGLLRP